MDAGSIVDTDKGRSRRGKGVAVSTAIGLLTGVVVTGAVGLTAMPGMMIVTEQSQLDFDETVAALGKAITEQGWISPGTVSKRKSSVSTNAA